MTAIQMWKMGERMDGWMGISPFSINNNQPINIWWLLIITMDCFTILLNLVTIMEDLDCFNNTNNRYCLLSAHYRRHFK